MGTKSMNTNSEFLIIKQNRSYKLEIKDALNPRFTIFYLFSVLGIAFRASEVHA